MKKKQEQRVDPITGYPTLPWYGAVIGGFGVFTILISFAFALPSPSLELLPILLVIGLAGSINFIWFRTKPNLISKFVFQVTLSTIFASISFRSFQFLLPGYAQVLGILLAFLLLFAHTLPMWNPTITKFIRDSLSPVSRKSRLQKLIFKYSFVLLGITIVIGFVLDLFFSKKVVLSIGQSFIMGVIFGSLAIILPFSDQHPSSPWEKQEVDSNDD